VSGGEIAYVKVDKEEKNKEAYRTCKSGGYSVPRNDNPRSGMKEEKKFGKQEKSPKREEEKNIARIW